MFISKKLIAAPIILISLIVLNHVLQSTGNTIRTFIELFKD